MSAVGSPKYAEIPLLLAGALDDKHKGQLVAISALQKLPGKYVLHVVGDGDDQDLIENFAGSLGLSSRVKLFPWSRLAELLRAERYFCALVPSRHEGLGSLLIDLMRWRLPIIASNVGGIPDLIRHGDTGILCEPGDYECITSQIEALFANPGMREKLVESAYQESLRFSPETMFDQYMDVYRSLSRDFYEGDKRATGGEIGEK